MERGLKAVSLREDFSRVKVLQAEQTGRDFSERKVFISVSVW